MIKKFIFLLFTVFFLIQSLFSQIVEVQLIHWNDFHSANLPFVPTINNPEKVEVGGSAVLAGYIDSLRKVYEDPIVLNAGDDFQGSPVSSITKGLSQILIMNKIMPDVMTIGNHEFDYGRDELRSAVSQAKFPIVSSNIFDEEKGQLFVKPYEILHKGDVDIAVIGTIYETLKSSVIPSNVEGLKILSQVESVRKYVNEIREKVDLIVVLSHSGLYEDSTMATQLEEVDIIVGGHSHSWVNEPRKVNGILILQAGARGERLGLLKIKMDKEQNAIESYTYDFIRTDVTKVKPNAVVAALVDSLEINIRKEMDQQIGTLEKDWVRNSHDESNIGNWICDATKEKFQVDIALQNSGGIRKNLSAGPITVRDIWEISPFDNSIQIVELSGRQLLDMINYRLENPRDLLQIAGLKIYYDGKTGILQKATVDDKPVEDDKTYTIATNNYIMSHSERFFGIDPKKLTVRETSYLGRDVLLEAVKKQQIISGDTENRLIDISRN
ncbi:MAG: bifunctional metallophosphatase/5'-nucleotidase [Candidatus Marinimicrobia bacterium]|nr:bifunctional metallophosphatase/5'-nucleotidase [Candidatus Neomarinimicrobiota bacterium]